MNYILICHLSGDLSRLQPLSIVRTCPKIRRSVPRSGYGHVSVFYSAFKTPLESISFTGQYGASSAPGLSTFHQLLCSQIAPRMIRLQPQASGGRRDLAYVSSLPPPRLPHSTPAKLANEQLFRRPFTRDALSDCIRVTLFRAPSQPFDNHTRVPRAVP